MTTDAKDASKNDPKDDPTKLYDPNDPRYYGYSKFQFRLWHGMTTWAFLSMLKGNFKYVSPQRYGLVASVFAMSLLHSLLAIFVRIFYTGRINKTEFAGDPVCIIGFQRSGTTFFERDDRLRRPLRLP